MNKIWNETMSQFELPAPPDNPAQAAREARGEPAAGELHFRELLNLLRRRSRSILAITLCGAMLVFAVGLLIPPKFTAKAEIAIYMPSTGGQGAAVPVLKGRVCDCQAVESGLVAGHRMA